MTRFSGEGQGSARALIVLNHGAAPRAVCSQLRSLCPSTLKSATQHKQQQKIGLEILLLAISYFSLCSLYVRWYIQRESTFCWLF